MKGDHASVGVRRNDKGGSHKEELNRYIEMYGNRERDKRGLPRKRRSGILEE
ncbi:hypothetical protein KSB_92810 [Ktedonobacter robiniae]|uniref:Uncharacterized protein n=1 Tax=Ktedonobacter robiniae TaxID=2778365 RepID=A0ABQ3V6E3_9CHLR|nr:hypothetical protein KSB_92810 [Ktedonobacter robiniae]